MRRALRKVFFSFYSVDSKEFSRSSLGTALLLPTLDMDRNMRILVMG